MGGTRIRSAARIVLDAGALIALDRGDNRMIALARPRAGPAPDFPSTRAGVVAQAWRDGRVQATLARLLRSQETEIVPLNEQLARSCGELCGVSGSRDIVDASVVILAKEREDLIVTSDPSDLRRLDPSARIISI